MVGFPIELIGAELVAHGSHDLLALSEYRVGEHAAPVLRHEHHADVECGHGVPGALVLGRVSGDPCRAWVAAALSVHG